MMLLRHLMSEYLKSMQCLQIKYFPPNYRTTGCSDAHSFCGLRDAKYPDKRKMGYPFDRVYTADTLQTFAGNHTNMQTGLVNIQFLDLIVDE